MSEASTHAKAFQLISNALTGTREAAATVPGVKSSDAKGYSKALDLLKKAEARHQEALDAIDAAKTAGRSDKLPKLRNLAQESERHLGEAWEDAGRAHRGYWLARRIRLVPELHRLARVAREYDALAKASGDTTVHPWRAIFDGEFVRSFNAQELVQDVPLESPECELFNEEFGAWR